MNLPFDLSKVKDWIYGEPGSWIGHALIGALITLLTASILSGMAAIWTTFVAFLYRELEDAFHGGDLTDGYLDIAAPVFTSIVLVVLFF